MRLFVFKMLITSKSNPKIKKIASLKQKKYREEFGEYLVEGYKMVKEAIEMGMDLATVVLTEEGLLKMSDIVEKTNAEIVEISESVMDYISDSVTPQGVIASIKKPTPIKGNSKIKVLLDGVSDPGAACRTSEAAFTNCDSFIPERTQPQ